MSQFFKKWEVRSLLYAHLAYKVYKVFQWYKIKVKKRIIKVLRNIYLTEKEEKNYQSFRQKHQWTYYNKISKPTKHSHAGSRSFCNNISLIFFCLNYLICGIHASFSTNWQLCTGMIADQQILNKGIYNCCELRVTQPETWPLVTSLHSMLTQPVIHLNPKTVSLRYNRYMYHTGNQHNSQRTGETWPNFLTPLIIWAAKFCTCCNYLCIFLSDY